MSLFAMTRRQFMFWLINGWAVVYAIGMVTRH